MQGLRTLPRHAPTNDSNILPPAIHHRFSQYTRTCIVCFRSHRHGCTKQCAVLGFTFRFARQDRPHYRRNSRNWGWIDGCAVGNATQLNAISNTTGFKGNDSGQSTLTCFCYSASAGADIILLQRDPSTGTAVKEKVRSLGRTCDSYACDLGDKKQIRGIIPEICERNGRNVDILVNCGGVQHRSPAVDFAEESWDEVCFHHVKGLS